MLEALTDSISCLIPLLANKSAVAPGVAAAQVGTTGTRETS